MLRKGDLIKWLGFNSTSYPLLAIVMEDQKRDWPRVLVYWLDGNELSREQISFMVPLRERKDA